MIVGVFVASVSQMLLKKAANNTYKSHIKEYLNVWVICGYGLMVVSTLCAIFAYRGLEYKYGPAIESLGFVFVLIMSNIFYKEKITKIKIIGNILIIIGVLVFCL